ncbi:MAG: hypothetical protein J4400_00905 [Candidatus Aenigmarchaeota archaeon]|nr:hypothetical protein [Candidatus Aenigmarchaeota archaeon]
MKQRINPFVTLEIPLSEARQLGRLGEVERGRALTQIRKYVACLYHPDATANSGTLLGHYNEALDMLNTPRDFTRYLREYEEIPSSGGSAQTEMSRILADQAKYRSRASQRILTEAEEKLRKAEAKENEIIKLNSRISDLERQNLELQEDMARRKNRYNRDRSALKTDYENLLRESRERTLRMTLSVMDTSYQHEPLKEGSVRLDDIRNSYLYVVGTPALKGHEVERLLVDGHNFVYSLPDLPESKMPNMKLPEPEKSRLQGRLVGGLDLGNEPEYRAYGYMHSELKNFGRVLDDLKLFLAQGMQPVLVESYRVEPDTTQHYGLKILKKVVKIENLDGKNGE